MIFLSKTTPMEGNKIANLLSSVWGSFLDSGCSNLITVISGLFYTQGGTVSAYGEMTLYSSIHEHF